MTVDRPRYKDAPDFVASWTDGRALYVQGENGVLIKVGKRDMVQLACSLIVFTKYMLVPRAWASKIAKPFKETPARLKAGKAVK